MSARVTFHGSIPDPALEILYSEADVFIMPAVTAFVASFFSDEIADEVEHVHYPADPPGAPISLTRATIEGVKTALLALLVYLIAVPFLLTCLILKRKTATR